MKNIKRVLISALALVALTACATSYKAGTYEGEATGYSPDKKIKVSVTVDDKSKISEVKVVEHAETEEIGGVAFETLIKSAIEKGSADFDSVTGATVTSEGFKDAIKAALEKAK